MNSEKEKDVVSGISSSSNPLATNTDFQRPFKLQGLMQQELGHYSTPDVFVFQGSTSGSATFQHQEPQFSELNKSIIIIAILVILLDLSLFNPIDPFV